MNTSFAHPQQALSSSDRSNTQSQNGLDDGYLFPQEYDVSIESIANTFDATSSQSLHYPGCSYGLSSSISGPLSPSPALAQFETQSFLSPFTCPNQPSAAVFFESPTLDVPLSSSLPTGTSPCLDPVSTKNNDPRTPLATIEGITTPCPPINHGPTTSVAYECSDTPPEPFSVLEANPTPAGTEGHYSEAWPPMPMTHPTTHYDDLNTCFQHITSNQGTSSFHGKPQSDSNPTTKDRRRQRNSLAARRYRQRRLDRIAELEQALAKTEKERDSLKVQLECWKMKAELLQELSAGSKGNCRAHDVTERGLP